MLERYKSICIKESNEKHDAHIMLPHDFEGGDLDKEDVTYKLIQKLHNKSVINSILKKITTAFDRDMDFEDIQDKYLYKFDDALFDGVEKLLEKIGIPKNKINYSPEDNNTYFSIDDVTNDQMEELKKYGFKE